MRALTLSKSVILIDYGASNLLSVRRAFQHIGVDVRVAVHGAELVGAGHVVLPGVGAFGKAMGALEKSGLHEAIHAHVASGRPFLGICLGMQMMMDQSEEFGIHRGLGLIAGNVVAIPAHGMDGAAHKIPRIGWAYLRRGEAAREGDYASIIVNVPMYFVHSFMAVPSDPCDRLANVDYGGLSICAAIQRDNMLGFQGHPEKSGEAGLELLRQFVG